MAHSQMRYNGFSERKEQLEMALAIEDAIQNNKQLIAEAGTGTGKTFAYLVPAPVVRRQGDYFDRHQNTARSAI